MSKCSRQRRYINREIWRANRNSPGLNSRDIYFAESSWRTDAATVMAPCLIQFSCKSEIVTKKHRRRKSGGYEDLRESTGSDKCGARLVFSLKEILFLRTKMAADVINKGEQCPQVSVLMCFRLYLQRCLCESLFFVFVSTMFIVLCSKSRNL